MALWLVRELIRPSRRKMPPLTGGSRGQRGRPPAETGLLSQQSPSPSPSWRRSPLLDSRVQRPRWEALLDREGGRKPCRQAPSTSRRRAKTLRAHRASAPQMSAQHSQANTLQLAAQGPGQLRLPVAHSRPPRGLPRLCRAFLLSQAHWRPRGERRRLWEATHPLMDSARRLRQPLERWRQLRAAAPSRLSPQSLWREERAPCLCLQRHSLITPWA
mmetsp:Transcript_26847/g.63696  ORF Transcript_26847/g.63696 Transcript_26847/m.63696 type:complete len:216 (+) Transcript_26847:1871-2518(+)